LKLFISPFVCAIVTRQDISYFAKKKYVCAKNKEVSAKSKQVSAIEIHQFFFFSFCTILLNGLPSSVNVLVTEPSAARLTLYLYWILSKNTG
jgi:hypothetical protein